MRKVKVGYQLDFRNPPGSTLSFRDLYRESFAQIDLRFFELANSVAGKRLVSASYCL